MSSSNNLSPKAHEPMTLESDTTHERSEKSRIPVSCTKAFDAVYYCYSPFHQAREYYIYGELDDCRGRLRKFRLCALSRLKPKNASEKMFEQEEINENMKRPKSKPVWQMKEEYLKTVEEFDRRESAENPGNETKEEQTGWWL